MSEIIRGVCSFFSHFSSTGCTCTMAKRSQHGSGEEQVTAKSRPMMHLIARAPLHVSSSTSVSLGGEVMEVKILGVRFLRKWSDRGDLVQFKDSDH